MSASVAAGTPSPATSGANRRAIHQATKNPNGTRRNTQSLSGSQKSSPTSARKGVTIRSIASSDLTRAAVPIPTPTPTSAARARKPPICRSARAPTAGTRCRLLNGLLTGGQGRRAESEVDALPISSRTIPRPDQPEQHPDAGGLCRVGCGLVGPLARRPGRFGVPGPGPRFPRLGPPPRDRPRPRVDRDRECGGSRGVGPS